MATEPMPQENRETPAQREARKIIRKIGNMVPGSSISHLSIDKPLTGFVVEAQALQGETGVTLMKKAVKDCTGVELQFGHRAGQQVAYLSWDRRGNEDHSREVLKEISKALSTPKALSQPKPAGLAFQTTPSAVAPSSIPAGSAAKPARNWGIIHPSTWFPRRKGK